MINIKGSEKGIIEDLKGSILGWDEMIEEERDNLVTLIEEYISQAYKQGIKETAMVVDKEMKGWLQSNVTGVADFLKGIREESYQQGKEDGEERIKDWHDD